MHKSWFIWLLAAASTHAEIYPEQKKNALEENLTLRRIAEYWKEGELTLVKSQIQSFLLAYPGSTHADSLNAMLGDLLFNEKNYKDAHLTYRKIQDPLFQQQTEYPLLYCLYQEGLFDEVISLGTAFLEKGQASTEQQQAVRFQLADSLFHLGNCTKHLDAKNNLYIQSISHFKRLASTPYAEQTVYPLAVMYTSLKENEKAAALYEQLAESHPAQQEAFLFQAASLYLPINKNKSIELYGKIYPLQGKYAADAAFNQLQLLFAQKKYKTFLTTQETALQYISLEHFPQVRYYIGKSLFALGDYTHAAIHLLQFIENKLSNEKLVKNACLSLIQCAWETRNLPLFNQGMEHLLCLSPQEESTAHALLLHAHLCQEMGDLSRAQQGLYTLLKAFPQHVDRPQFLYDYGLLSSQLKKWDTAAAAFKEWIQAFPKHAYRPHAYRQLLMCQAELAKHASPETSFIKKEELIATLRDTLDQKKLLSATEKQQVLYCLGKTLYDIHQYDEALDILSEYVDAYPNNPSIAHAYLLMAYCHMQGDFNPSLFTLHAEKALGLNDNLPQRELLHLQLYNAYLLLAENATGIDKSPILDQAAHHLFCARNQPLQPQNHRWLAHYYLHKFSLATDVERDLYLSRSIATLEQLLTATPIQTPEMESEVIRLSQLYLASGQHEQAIDLLEDLQHTYQVQTDIPWKYQRLSLFELAEHYEQGGYLDEAIDVYDQLIDSGTHAYSYFSTAARLKKCHLAFDRMTPDQRTENSPAVQLICDELKNLQLQRRLASEPWHLEAAMTYIDIKTALASEEKRDLLRQQLIDQAYDFFASQNDPLVKQYLGAAEQFPEQMAAYTQYIQFLNTEQLRLKSLLQADELAQAEAAVRYQALLEQPIHSHLKKRIKLACPL